MRRFLFLLLMAAIVLAACNPTVTLLGPDQKPGPTVQRLPLPSPAARTPVPTPTRAHNLIVSPEALKGVEVLAWHGWDGVSASLFEQMAGEFNLSNQWGLKVRVAGHQNLNLLAAAVEKSLAGPEQPDMVIALPEQILTWQTQVVDLGPYMLQPGIGFSPDDLPPVFGAQSMLEGVRYGLPAARTGYFIFYNTSFASDLGFSSVPQTPQDFREQACSANAFWKRDKDPTNDGFGGLALDVNSDWQAPYSWLAGGGGRLLSAGEMHFNTPENLAALEYVAKLREDDCAWLPDTLSNYEHLATRHALFITGRLDAIADQVSAFSVAASPDKWTLLPFPGQKPGFVAYGPDYAVLKTTDARQMAAWLFIRWMLEPQNQVRWSRGTGLLPVTLPAIDQLNADGSVPPQWKAALELIPQAQTYPLVKNWSLANKLLADGFSAYFRNYPNIPLADILDTMDTTFQEVIKK
jgi:ABC-type glycerol-3-phosphate transport system substrate-binding protein